MKLVTSRLLNLSSLSKFNLRTVFLRSSVAHYPSTARTAVTTASSPVGTNLSFTATAEVKTASGTLGSHNATGNSIIETGVSQVCDTTFGEQSPSSAVSRADYGRWNQVVDSGVDPRIIKNVLRMGWIEPLKIQRKMIPPALEGRNVVATAQTGQGKTGAFAIPILQQILLRKESAAPSVNPGPRALIITPTSELTHQVAATIQSISRGLCIKTEAIYHTMETLSDQIKRAANADIVVGSPGRLISHIDHHMLYKKVDPSLPAFEGFEVGGGSSRDLNAGKFLSIANVETLVLDEVDKLLNSASLPHVLDIRNCLPRPKRDPSVNVPGNIVAGLRNTLLVTATLCPSTHDSISRLVPKHVLLDMNREMKVPKNIKQVAYRVQNRKKRGLLKYLLNYRGRNICLPGKRILIFCRTASRCDFLATWLSEAGHKAAALYADCTPDKKRIVIDDFSKAVISIVVATDLVTRGIDILDIDYVINFDVPHIPEDYVHRVGRTGRAGKAGSAITFVGTEVQTSRKEYQQTILDEQELFRNIKRFIGDHASADKRSDTRLFPGYQLTGIEERKIPGNWEERVTLDKGSGVIVGARSGKGMPRCTPPLC